jgi:hypothetical protein
MSTTIDINVTPTIQEVTINTVDNITVINVNTQSGGGIQTIVAGTNVTVDDTDPLNPIINATGGGGSQTLNQTLVLGNSTNGENIVLDSGDAIVLDNGSKLQKGTTDAGNGGNKGIALKCSLDYELKWEAGVLYVMEQDGFTIRESLYNQTTPTVNDDDTKGFVGGSRWTNENRIYRCDDATTGDAVWVRLDNIIPTLDQVLTAGNTSDKSIILDEGAGGFRMAMDFGSTIISITENSSGNLGYLSESEMVTRNATNTIFGEYGMGYMQLKTTATSSIANIKGTNLTSNRNYELPNASGTIALTSDIPTIDATPTDGSANAVSSNCVFDALATKADKSSTPNIVVRNITPSTALTGTTIETQITSFNFTIPANTFSENDILKVETIAWEKSGTANASTCRIKLSNTNNYAGASNVLILAASGGNINMRGTRTYKIAGGNLKGFMSASANGIFNDNTLSSVAVSTLALDVTQPIYGFVSLTNSSSADSTIVNELIISKW